MEMRKFLTLLAVLLPVACFAGSKDIKTVTFNTHMHCENCVKKVIENISFLKGVKDLDVSLEKQQITVKYDAAKTDEKTLGGEIVKLGYPADVVVAAEKAVKMAPEDEMAKKVK